jgi:hypothetical protein
MILLQNEGDGGSSHVRIGSSDPKRPPTDDVVRFFSMLRFNSKEKLQKLMEKEAN